MAVQGKYKKAVFDTNDNKYKLVDGAILSQGEGNKYNEVIQKLENKFSKKEDVSAMIEFLKEPIFI